jgi:RecA/RadA recombinase
MRAAISKKEIESALAARFESSLPARQKISLETLTTGITEIDALSNGLPRGAITEITGATSSGRTSVLLSVLAQATWGDEACALIDIGDRFDPASAAHAGIALDRLLWIRGANNLERAFKATDLVLQTAASFCHVRARARGPVRAQNCVVVVVSFPPCDRTHAHGAGGDKSDVLCSFLCFVEFRAEE